MHSAITWDDLVSNYCIFINTDSVPVEAMEDDIRRFAEISNRRFDDVLDQLYDTVFWLRTPEENYLPF